MVQKIIKVGDSSAITIPKNVLEELGLHAGDEVGVSYDQETGTLVVQMAGTTDARQRKIAELTNNFIERYRRDLEALADK